jgi:hypothetical protein
MLRRVLAVLLLILAAGEVRANYTEAHIAGEDAWVVVERDGRMTVTHVVAYRVLAGTLRSFAITGFEDDLRFHPTASVTSADGKTFGASVTHDDKDVLHVTVDDPKGLKRGDYRFELVYEGTLVGRRVARDGAFERVRFALPPMREGIDGARVVLDLPSAPTEPRAVSEGDVAADLSNLRRSAERDELEMVRPHVAKGEGATFFARIDPKALPLVNDPALRAPPPPPPAELTVTKPTLPIAILACASTLALFALALAKSRVLPREAMGLLPGPASVRAALAGLAFGAGVVLEAQARFVSGAALVALAMLFCASRVKAPARAARGPAAWSAQGADEAFAREMSPADWLDGTTRRGALVLFAFAIACALASHLSRTVDGAAPYVVAIDALAVLAVFFTGTSRQLPPTRAREGHALAPVARALAKNELDVNPYARNDEMRLFATSQLAMPGVVAIEVGVAWERAPSILGGASVASFDVLVRVLDGTFAAAKIAGAFPKKRALPGRKPEERVFRFEPEGPSVSDVATLVGSLAETLRDRRIVIEASPAESGKAFRGAERRLPPNARRAARSPL